MPHTHILILIQMSHGRIRRMVSSMTQLPFNDRFVMTYRPQTSVALFCLITPAFFLLLMATHSLSKLVQNSKMENQDEVTDSSHHSEDSSEEEEAVLVVDDDDATEEEAVAVEEGAEGTQASNSPRRSPRHLKKQETTAQNNQNDESTLRRSPRFPPTHSSNRTKRASTSSSAVRTSLPKKLFPSKDRKVSKRKGTSASRITKAAATTKRLKKNAKQKAFQLSSDKKKPDPLMMKRIVFDVRDDAYGQELVRHFGGLSKISKSLVNGRYLYGTIVRLSKQAKRSGVFYDIEWEDANLGITPIELSCLISAIDLCTALRNEKYCSKTTGGSTSTLPTNEKIAQLLGKKMLSALTAVDELERVSELNESDDDMDDCEKSDLDSTNNDQSEEEEDDFHFDLLRKYTFPQTFASEADVDLQTEDTSHGFRWSSEGTLSPPTNLSKAGPSEVKAERKGCFSDPLSSLFAFIPFKMFKSFVIYSNAYANALMAASGKREISGARWSSDITIGELMNFFGLLFHMVLRPTPGAPYTSCWSDPGWHPYTGHMRLRRFQQIRSVLHYNFSEPGKKTKSKDALYKVRPLLNCLKLSFPLYLKMGDNFALDEASVASRSKYGNDIIFFNPTKPGGKYHFRFYLLCCSTSYVCIRLRMHTKNASDSGDGYYEQEQEQEEEVSPVSEVNDASLVVPDQEEKRDPEANDTTNNQPVKKLVSLVLDMCKPLFGSGAVVNMDNYYTSPEVAVALKNNGVYIRGTCRTNRLGFPVAVRFTNAEANSQGRGRIKRVVDIKNHLAAYGWVDGNPVHFLTSADGTATTDVKRRISRNIEKVRAPVGIKRYNQNMHAVDRHDQLRETFSLSKRHGFKKYYHKVAMGLFDMAVVNAWLHFKLVHKEHCRQKSARYDFIYKLANSLLQTDWQEYGNTETAQLGDDIFRSLVGDGDETGEDNSQNVDGNLGWLETDHPRCQPLLVSGFLGQRRERKTGLSCQVCAFEGRGEGSLRSVVICLCHRLCLCTVARVNKDSDSTLEYSWRAPEGTSCWYKAHSFYIPQGLFADNVTPMSTDEVSKLTEGKTIRFQCVKTGCHLFKKKHLAYAGTGGREPIAARKKRKPKATNSGRKKRASRQPGIPLQIDDNCGSSSSDEDTSFRTAESREYCTNELPFTIGTDEALDDDDSNSEAFDVKQRAWL